MTARYDVKEFRSELKKVGYKLRTKTYSDFIGATVVDSEGNAVNQQIFFGNDDLVAYREKHKDALDIIDKYKGKVFSGTMRVVV